MFLCSKKVIFAYVWFWVLNIIFNLHANVSINYDSAWQCLLTGYKQTANETHIVKTANWLLNLYQSVP